MTAETRQAEDASVRRDPDFVEALSRGLAVLACFAERAGGPGRGRLTLTEVAQATGLTRGTARRLLLTLKALHYVESDGKSFWLTPKVLNFASGYLAPLGLGDAADAVLRELTETLGESASVGVLDEGDVVYVARVEVRRLYSSRLAVGSRLPANCSALGRVLLAGLGPAAREAWLARHPLAAPTARTIAEPEAMRAELEAIRAQGYAVVDEEIELGIRSIAVPIIGRSGRVLAALNASSSTARVSVETLRESFRPRLEAAARRLAATMDW